MNNQTNPLILFSVKRGDLPESVNNSHHEMVHRVLGSIGARFVPVTGVTKRWGRERSFLVVLPERSSNDNTLHDSILAIAKRYNQDAVVYVHEDRFAELVSLKGGPTEPLGILKPVSERRAMELGEYTAVGDLYYSTVA